jgi:hypothetical protein
MLFGAIHGSALILGVGLMCSVLDLVYIGLILLVTRRSVGTAEASMQIDSRTTG